MSFAATWMELETLILSEVKSERERQIPYDITYIWNLIYGTNMEVFPWKRNSWTWKIDLWLPRWRGREWDGLGSWGQQMQTIAFGMDQQ